MTDKKQNEFIYKISNHLREGLAEILKNVNNLYSLEELDGYIGVKDSPIEYIQAVLVPLIGQVNEFQDYAEAMTDRMVLDLQEVDIYAVLDGVISIVAQLSELNPAIILEEDIEEKLPAINGDPTRLSQALFNLIHNAFKFTENGRVTIRVVRELENILFEVRDTGIGIAIEDQELVFESFETILEDKNDPRIGFGIGLKIVEHIISLHGGETWFESKLKAGSSFYFTIPV